MVSGNHQSWKHDPKAIRCGVIVQSLRAPSGPYKPKKLCHADQQTRCNSFESLLETKWFRFCHSECFTQPEKPTRRPCHFQVRRGTCLGAGVNYGQLWCLHNRLDIVIENIIFDISSEHCDHIYQASNQPYFQPTSWTVAERNIRRIINYVVSIDV